MLMQLDKLALYFSYPFVKYALVVGVLIALCSSLLGVTLVLKRFSFIGDGLSHVAFGALAIASVLKLTNNMPFILGCTVLFAVLLLRVGQNTKIKGDVIDNNFNELDRRLSDVESQMRLRFLGEIQRIRTENEELSKRIIELERKTKDE